MTFWKKFKKLFASDEIKSYQARGRIGFTTANFNYYGRRDQPSFHSVKFEVEEIETFLVNGEQMSRIKVIDVFMDSSKSKAFSDALPKVLPTSKIDWAEYEIPEEFKR